jgi:hypothetical protein
LNNYSCHSARLNSTTSDRPANPVSIPNDDGPHFHDDSVFDVGQSPSDDDWEDIEGDDEPDEDAGAAIKISIESIVKYAPSVLASSSVTDSVYRRHDHRTWAHRRTTSRRTWDAQMPSLVDAYLQYKHEEPLHEPVDPKATLSVYMVDIFGESCPSISSALHGLVHQTAPVAIFHPPPKNGSMPPWSEGGIFLIHHWYLDVRFHSELWSCTG